MFGFFQSKMSLYLLSVNDVQSNPICHEFFVYDILKWLKTNKAIGSDHIPPMSIEIAAQFICHWPIFSIFSHYNNDVPDVWKVTDIVPVLKTSRIKKERLRPIFVANY